MAVLVAALAACGSSGSGDQADRRGPSTTRPATAAGASAETCQAIETLILEPALLESPRDQPMEPEEGVAIFEAAAAAAPSADADAWAAIVALAEREAATPGSATAEDTAAVYDLVERSAGWAREVCPPDHPIWACVSHPTFEYVGNATGSDGKGTEPPPGEPTAEAVLADTKWEGARELDSSADAVLYGRLDANGDVVATLQVERSSGAWTEVASSECQPDDAVPPAPGTSTSVPSTEGGG